MPVIALLPVIGGGDAVADAGGDREVAVEVRRRGEGHAGEQGVDVGERAAGGPDAGAGVVGRGHRAGGGRVQAAGGGVRQRQRRRDVGAVHVADHDVGQVERRVFGVGLGGTQVGRGRRVVDRGAGHRLAAGDGRGDAVADAGGDGEVAVEVRRRGEGHAGEQRVDVGDARRWRSRRRCPRCRSRSPRRRWRCSALPAAAFDKVSVAVTLALSTSLTTMSVRLSGVSSV